MRVASTINSAAGAASDSRSRSPRVGQPVRERRRRAEVLDARREHQLGTASGGARGDDVARARRASARRRAKSSRSMTREDRPLGGGERLLGRAGGEQLLGRLLVPALVGEQPAVREAQRADLVGAAALEQLQQVLAEARMAAQRAPARRASRRAGARARSDASRSPASAVPERRRRARRSPRRAPTSRRGSRDRRRAAGRGCARTGSRAADRPRRRRRPTCSSRAPRLEQHAGHPAAGGLDGGRRIDRVPLAELGERLGRLARA